MGVTSLVLGIVALLCGFFLAGLQWVGAIVGVIGIILGALGRKKPESKGIATAGLVCSIIGFIVCIIIYVACAGACAALSGAAGSLS